MALANMSCYVHANVRARGCACEQLSYVKPPQWRGVEQQPATHAHDMLHLGVGESDESWPRSWPADKAILCIRGGRQEADRWRVD